MRVFGTFLVLAVIGGASASACAQSTGTLIPGKTTTSPVQSSHVSNETIGDDREFEATESSRLALQFARETSRCVAEQNNVVTVNRLNADTAALYRKVERGYRNALSLCLYKVQQAHGDKKFALRITGNDHFVLAEAYLQRNGVSEIRAWSLDEYLNSEHAKVSNQFRLANCLAYTHPLESKALVMSTPYGDDEAAAFRAISPFVAECVSAGSTITVGKTWLRLRLASTLYVRVAPKTPRSATSAKKDRQ